MKNRSFPAYGEAIVDDLIADYTQENRAAINYLKVSQEHAWPIIIDHIALRCLNVEQRVSTFLEHGYVFQNESVEYPEQGWWAKIYRKAGRPVLFVDQAYDDQRGAKSIIPDWVKRFGDQHLHHVAVLVEDIESAVAVMKKNGTAFSGQIVGSPGSRLRQIFSVAENRSGAPYTVLELTERNNYTGFYPDQADALMQSSTQKDTESS